MKLRKVFMSHSIRSSLAAVAVVVTAFIVFIACINDVNGSSRWTRATKKTSLETLADVYNATSYNQIAISNKRIFDGLSEKQVKYVTKILDQLQWRGVLQPVAKIVKSLFREFNSKDVNFTNFISLTEFVAEYITEQRSRGVELKNLSQLNNLREITNKISSKINDIRREMDQDANKFEPYFRDHFAAAYHYYKHRFAPTAGVSGVVTYTEMSVAQYCELIKDNLVRVKELTKDDENFKSGSLVYEVYQAVHGRRLKIVLKKDQRGHLTFATCFFLEDAKSGDKDGDEWINEQKIEVVPIAPGA